MASQQCLTASFLVQLLTATHDFTATTGDTFYLALYNSNATMNTTTTVYAATNEITGTNYVAGGKALTSATPASSGITAYCNFSTLTWTALTATDVRYGLIYNSTKSNKSVCVLDFGVPIARTAQDFVVTFPPGAGASMIPGQSYIIQIQEN